MSKPDAHLGLYPENNENLLSSFHRIKIAVTSIWTPDVRIIKDYTDHGINHSQRILNWATELIEIMNSNGSDDLSDVERYLLAASGYLHDIGMQCDIIKFPHIKLASEALGADFTGVDFDAQFSSYYSPEAQKKIRDNHNYLSAAWIQCAHDNRIPELVSGLDDAARTIDALLLPNLIEICKYHSKEPINMDFAPCRFDREARVNLVAAILRFADELDITRDRVPEGIQKNFRLQLEDIKYWYLHERTHIYLQNEQLTYEILLHPDDISKCGSSLQEIIEEFKRKNNNLLEILRSSNIPISISDDSMVKAESSFERLPDEISDALAGIEQNRHELQDRWLMPER